MKHLICLILTIFISGTWANAQTEKAKKQQPPVVVATAFQKAFPNARKVKWEKENQDYEASFLEGGKQVSVVYNDKGSLLETETGIEPSQLPSAAQQYIKLTCKGCVIKEAAKIQKTEGLIIYEAQLKGKDYLFNSEGKFLSME